MTNHSMIWGCLLFLLCFSFSLVEAQFPQYIINEMALRKTRFHHNFWHLVRNNWNQLSPEDQEELRQLDWAPPRPALSADSTALTDNDSGEDFLLMHLKMIAKVNSMIDANNDPYGHVTGWTSIPGPFDRDYPVPLPPLVTNPLSSLSFAQAKSPTFYYTDIRPAEQQLTDYNYLKTITLGQMGSIIEFTIHNSLHVRFAGSSSVGYRPGDSGNIPQVDKQWDDPRYDWLADTYSSQVNPIFWKIHCWVNERIEDWRKANELSSITWKGTWEGGPMSNLTAYWSNKQATTGPNHNGDDDESASMDILDKVAAIFARNGISGSNFMEKVTVNWPGNPDLTPKTQSKPRFRKSCKSRKK